MYLSFDLDQDAGANPWVAKSLLLNPGVFLPLVLARYETKMLSWKYIRKILIKY